MRRAVEWTRTLPFRVALLLSVALLPLGLIAIAQTQRSISAAEKAFETTLRAQTAQIASPEREAIGSAFGLARGLADAIVALEPDLDACIRMMRQVRENHPDLSFIGYTNAEAVSECNDAGRRFDFSDSPSSQRLYADPQPQVTFNPTGAVSRTAVIVVSQPVYDAERVFRGFVAVSVPSRPIAVQRDDTQIGRLGAFLTFNDRGEILTTETEGGDIETRLPADAELRDLVGLGAFTFRAEGRDGIARSYSVVPIEPDRAYALGGWPIGPAAGLGGGWAASTPVFPLLMWLVSLVVALMAVNRLVIRHVRALGRRMRGFALTRQLPAADADPLRHAPTELREMDDAFDQMARKIVRDEADLENALFERGVLFKEVHHRVKNNLQLMTSITNIQIRHARSEEARAALRGVQERVTSLATVHGALYQSPAVSQVRIDALLGDLARQLMVIGVERRDDLEVNLSLDPLTLLPDQAAPLAMLTSEALTNALKYLGPDAAGRRYLSLRLAYPLDGGDARLEISNSVAPAQAESAACSGLGQRLIASFVQQLDGALEQVAGEDRFVVAVRFAPAPFTPEGDSPPAIVVE